MTFVHYDTGCNGFDYSVEKYPLVYWFTNDVYHCVIVKRQQRSRACLTSFLYEKFRVALVHSFNSPINGVSDTPTCAIFPYLLTLVNPKISLVIQSIRDSVAWWKSRWIHHGGHVGLICHPSLWNIVPHPFDFLGCLMKKRFAVEALMNYPRLILYLNNDTTLADQYFAQAFAAMNTYNALITPPEKHHLVCLWDHNQADANPFTFEDDRYIKSWLLGKKYRQPFFTYSGSGMPVSTTFNSTDATLNGDR
jgi:hypothetical protein